MNFNQIMPNANGQLEKHRSEKNIEYVMKKQANRKMTKVIRAKNALQRHKTSQIKKNICDSSGALPLNTISHCNF